MLKQGLQGITLQRYLISLGADFLPGSFICNSSLNFPGPKRPWQ